jgi:hypothetical protein
MNEYNESQQRNAIRERAIQHVSGDNETTKVDFKLKFQLQSLADKAELLKDIMSLVNSEISSDGQDDALLIIGAKKGQFIDIGSSPGWDESDIQSLVRDHLCHQLYFSLYKFACDEGKSFAVLHIPAGQSRPFLVKKMIKDNSSIYLYEGAGWTRDGSEKRPLTKADYDRMYADASKQKFKDELLPIVQDLEDRVSNKIEQVISHAISNGYPAVDKQSSIEKEIDNTVNNIISKIAKVANGRAWLQLSLIPLDHHSGLIDTVSNLDGFRDIAAKHLGFGRMLRPNYDGLYTFDSYRRDNDSQEITTSLFEINRNGVISYGDHQDIHHFQDRKVPMIASHAYTDMAIRTLKAANEIYKTSKISQKVYIYLSIINAKGLELAVKRRFNAGPFKSLDDSLYQFKDSWSQDDQHGLENALAALHRIMDHLWQTYGYEMAFHLGPDHSVHDNYALWE